MALTGHLSDLSLSELIEFSAINERAAVLKFCIRRVRAIFICKASVVDAHIGVLHGIDAVYYALTLPNAQFEFSADTEAKNRTINQPWTQVVLEGLRRLDENITRCCVSFSTFPSPMNSRRRRPQAEAKSEVERSFAPRFFRWVRMLVDVANPSLSAR